LTYVTLVTVDERRAKEEKKDRNYALCKAILRVSVGEGEGVGVGVGKGVAMGGFVFSFSAPLHTNTHIKKAHPDISQ
jgi:hypothetical protein